ncbi:hypothetical protein [Methylobacterium oryzisoli]|uniref:hypothetical protein n=1 Tax=Methylobacterium oryzisoli TaxID=3385502 RepID=UPI0038929678
MNIDSYSFSESIAKHNRDERSRKIAFEGEWTYVLYLDEYDTEIGDWLSDNGIEYGVTQIWEILEDGADSHANILIGFKRDRDAIQFRLRWQG